LAGEFSLVPDIGEGSAAGVCRAFTDSRKIGIIGLKKLPEEGGENGFIADYCDLCADCD
jgi:hypothetical protein